MLAQLLLCPPQHHTTTPTPPTLPLIPSTHPPPSLPPSQPASQPGGAPAMDGAHMAAADGGDCRYCSLCQRSWGCGRELMIMQSADVLRSSPVVKQQQLVFCVCVCVRERERERKLGHGPSVSGWWNLILVMVLYWYLKNEHVLDREHYT